MSAFAHFFPSQLPRGKQTEPKGLFLLGFLGIQSFNFGEAHIHLYGPVPLTSSSDDEERIGQTVSDSIEPEWPPESGLAWVYVGSMVLHS